MKENRTSPLTERLYFCSTYTLKHRSTVKLEFLSSHRASFNLGRTYQIEIRAKPERCSTSSSTSAFRKKKRMKQEQNQIRAIDLGRFVFFRTSEKILFDEELEEEQRIDWHQSIRSPIFPSILSRKTVVLWTCIGNTIPNICHCHQL